MKFVVLALPGSLGSGVQGFFDLLASAREALRLGGAPAPFELVLASPGGAAVRDGSGRLQGPGDELSTLGRCDAIFVPGFVIGRDARLPDAVTDPSVLRLLRGAARDGAIVASACSGALTLAAAGLLAGRRCTTTWWLVEALRGLAPDADLAIGAAIVEDRRVVTGAGPFSWIGVALRVLRMTLGAEAARTVANFTVVDTASTPQSLFIPEGFGATSDRFVVEAERQVRGAGGALDTPGLAAAMNVSVRTLQRRLHHALGETPKAFVDRVRLDVVKTGLELTSADISQVAAGAGYGDLTSFRRTFKRNTGMTPRAYRAWARRR